MLPNVDGMQKAIRQTKRWLFAAKQDANPYVAMLHANYAVGNIDLMRQLWSDYELATYGQINVHELLRDATQI